MTAAIREESMSAEGLPDAQPQGRPPLAGLVVLDFSHYVSAATCGLALADLGANVIKIERCDKGDDLRKLGPALEDASAWFHWANRNKRALALDLKSEQGRKLAMALVAKADVVIENFSTGVMDRFGLGPEAMMALNPRLVYCSVSAYGREGAFSQRAGFDPIVQAESGLMSLNGPLGSAGMRIGAPVADVGTGLMATIATMGALLARERDGRGQHVEVSLFDSAVALAALPIMGYLANGVIPEPAGSASRESAPTDVYRAMDGVLFIACPSESLFERLARDVLMRPELLADQRYSSNKARVANSDALRIEIESTLAQASRHHWIERLQAAQVPAGVINDLEDLVQSGEFTSRGLLINVSHPEAGSLPNLALPFRLGRTPVAKPFRAPRHGEHNQEILTELLHCSVEDFAQLNTNGAFGPSD